MRAAPGRRPGLGRGAGDDDRARSGSVNYFFQNDGLVARDKNAADQRFSRFDAAVTGGGPIVTNQAWFFGSYRRLERADAVENVQDQFYGRGTWAPGTADTLSFTFLNDPTDVSGRRDCDVTNTRDRRREQGGNNYHLKYNRLLTLRVEPHEAFEFAGFTRRWLSPLAVGTLGNPSYGIVDIRLLYNYRFAGYRVELFADIFNLLDDQDAPRNQDLLAGAGGIAFGDGIRFTPPRRMFLGARLSF